MILPLRPRPHNGESIIGYMGRLAIANGRTDLLVFSRLLGMQHAHIQAAATKPFDLAQFAEAADLQENFIRRLAYWPDRGKLFEFRGVPIDRCWVTLFRRRACPLCLGEAEYHRAVWDLTFSEVCPAHATRLLDRCPRCMTRLSWTSPSLAICSCGQDLRRCCSPLRLGASDIRSLAILQDMLAPQSGGQRPAGLFPDAIAAMDVNSIIGMVFCLGWFALGGSDLPRPVLLGQSGTDLNALLTRGLEITEHWPGAFYRLMDEVRASGRVSSGRYGARESLGEILNWAGSLDRAPALGALVWPEIMRYAHSNPELLNQVEASVPSANSGKATFSRAARRLGKSINRVRGIFEGKSAENWQVIQSMRSRSLFLTGVWGGSVSAEPGLDERALSKRLCCGKNIVSAVIRADVIPCVAGSPPEIGRPKIWSAVDVEAFLSGLELSVVVVDPVSELLPFPTAYRLVRRAGVAPDFAVKMLAGLIIPAAVGRSRRGLWRILYSGNELSLLIHRSFMAARRVTITQAARELGLRLQVACRLTSAGHLRTVFQEGTRGRLVDREELGRFRLTYYVPHPRLAPFGATTGELLAAGLTPISGPQVDGTLQCVFWRSDVRRIGAPEDILPLIY